MKTIHPSIALADGGYRQRDPEEIRRLIAWVLCDAMPPDDATLREIYADNILLASLGATAVEFRKLCTLFAGKFSISIREEETDSWKNIGDVIGFVNQRRTAVTAS